MIHCSDNTWYEETVLVRAVGAYSGVRQSLYKQLKQGGLLPKVDQESLSIGYVSLVGVANPQDPEKYLQLKDNFTHYSQVLGRDNRSWGVRNMASNQVCWLVSAQLSESEAKGQQFRNSEWGPEANKLMIKEFRDLPNPWGGTMGETFDDTPKDLISKVFLEEKLFKTWYHGRTVLLGDGEGS
ncbi:hypothetical protein EDD11_005556 [Mortierella claussenii]|nr:hypothetical protein EDD11_005556 [Mortierella claussenii]